MNPLGLENLTVYGCHPLEVVRIAAETGCSHVSFFTRSLNFPGLPPPPPNLFDDALLRKDVMSCLDDHDVSIALIDGFSIWKDISAADYRPLFDVLGELGVTRINTTATDEWNRCVDEIGLLAEMAAEYGQTLTVEAVATFTIGTLPQAIEVVEKIARPNFKLLIDTMHVARTGGAGLLATIDPKLIDYVQICDAPLTMPSAEIYMDEALHQRQIPGEGELPLVDMMACIAPDIIVSMEVPLRSLRQAGVSDLERTRLSSVGTRKVLDAAGKARAGEKPTVASDLGEVEL